MNAALLLTLREMRDASRNRSLIAAAAAFALLCAALTFSGTAGSGSGFGPAAAGLINVELIAIPLFALVLGAMQLSRDRERGTYGYFRALPVTALDIYCSKVTAVFVQVTAIVCAGFAGAFAAMALAGVGGADVWGIVQFALLTWVLGIACGAIGLLISVCAPRSPSALGSAVAVWLTMVIFGDLGLMATSLATRMSLGMLVFFTAINPVEAYKIAAVAALSGSIDVLGPGGRLTADLLGSAIMPAMVAVLVAWSVAALGAGYFILGRRADA